MGSLLSFGRQPKQPCGTNSETVLRQAFTGLTFQVLCPHQNFGFQPGFRRAESVESQPTACASAEGSERVQRVISSVLAKTSTPPMTEARPSFSPSQMAAIGTPKKVIR